MDRPDAAQTVVAQFLPAPPRNSPDYDALTLVDAVWGGGGFGTRLNLNLREKHGYSYGVFSNFNPMRTAGNWVAGGGVQTDKTSESVTEFDKEMKDLAGAKPISDDELAVAKARRVARLRAAVRVARPDHRRDLEPLGAGLPLDGTAARVRRHGQA